MRPQILKRLILTLIFKLWNEWWNIRELRECQLGNLEKLPLRLRHNDVSYMLKRKNVLEWTNLVMVLQHVIMLCCIVGGYESPAARMYSDELFDVTHWKSSRNYPAILILYHKISLHNVGGQRPSKVLISWFVPISGETGIRHQRASRLVSCHPCWARRGLHQVSNAFRD